MNVQNTAIQILKDVGKPLHAKEIAERIVEAGLWSSDGKTPEATVSARLYSSIEKDSYPFCQLREKTIVNNKDVDVFIVQLDELHDDISFYMQFLSQDELLRSLSYKFEEDKYKYILRRSLLRILLSTYIGVPPDELSFCYNRNGKPYLKGARFYFNTSHSDEYFVLAMSYLCEMGIDIEGYTEFDDPEEILKTICDNSEIFNFTRSGCGNMNISLLSCWTGKEAYLKKIGSGLTVDPRRIHIDTQKTTSEFSNVLFDGIETKGCILRSWITTSNPKLFISLFVDAEAFVQFVDLKQRINNFYLER